LPTRKKTHNGSTQGALNIDKPLRDGGKRLTIGLP
jgi:hypothetical protein